jgi:glutaredoxin
VRRRVVVMLLLLAGCAPVVPPATPAQRAQVRVTIYTTRWCPACAGARSWLSARGIPFDDRDVEESPAAMARMRSINRAGTVPTIVVEGAVVAGFDAEALRTAVDRAAHRY